MKKLRHFKKSELIQPRSHHDIGKVNYPSFESISAAAESAPKPSNPSLVNSSNGKISRILLTIPEYAFTGNDNAYRKVYSDLLTKLPEYTNFLILTHEHIHSSVKNWLQHLNVLNRTQIEAVDKHLQFSIWAEDAHAITYDQENDNNIFFAQPFEFTRYADSIVSKISSNVTNSTIYQAPLYFQGGNILIGDNFFFIGKDYANNSLGYIPRIINPEDDKDNEQLIEELYNQYLDNNKKLYYIASAVPVPTQQTIPLIIDDEEWNQIVYFGNKKDTVQPLFHIDMFISLIGRNDGGKYQIIVGDPKMASELLDFPECLEFAMADVFDNIAEQLSKMGDFEIIRNPLPLVYLDDPENKERIWYFATSNNCLIENTGDEKNVWLPTYGHGSWKELSITDNVNKEIWESLGYVVHSLEDFHPFAENLGAVHCIKKYLKR